MAVALWLVVLGNGAIVVWLWLHGGNVSLAGEDLGGLLTSLGRVTALVGTYLVLVQVVLLARVPWIERRVGFDRLTVWHRRNGKVAITLVVLHVPLIIVGYALTDQISVRSEISSVYDSYPGIWAATVGTAVLIVVVLSSLMIVRRRLRYEAWYLIHLSVYAGILLTYFHEVPDGNELSANASQRDYWYALYLVAIGLLVCFRLVAPAVRAWRYRLRVTEIHRESPHVVSVYMEGRRLERLGGRGGQFFLWRFLDRRRWWQAHPFSMSAAPDGRRLRITVKDVGDFSGDLGTLRPGTRVIAEGPFGTFTPDHGAAAGSVLIAGGIGITPLRAMLDELLGRGRPVTLIHRVLHDEDLVLRDELAGLAVDGALAIVNVVGDHTGGDGASLLSAEHLRAIVPNLAECEVYLCGPPSMMRHVRAGLAEAGVPQGRIHSERFALAAH
jgi:predicted ferric reductase